jgi:hypothetical protein
LEESEDDDYEQDEFENDSFLVGDEEVEEDELFNRPRVNMILFLIKNLNFVIKF